jgi:succinate dehydrogenase / fumarate reductase flavoprotein subunit
MGGIPANINTEVICDAKGTVVRGLYTAGEAACLSLHGANRLGTNSLQDAATFGRTAGKSISKFIENNFFEKLPNNHLDNALEKVAKLRDGKGAERHAFIREELQENMTKLVGVFRKEDDMLKLRGIIKELQERYKNVSIDYKGDIYNMDLFEAFEVGNLLSFSEVMVEGAIARKESRGAHFRVDYPKRDDEKWMKHTLAWKTKDGIKLDHTKEVIIYMDRFPPIERKY